MDNEEQVEGGDPRTPGISAATIARFIVLLDLSTRRLSCSAWTPYRLRTKP